MNTRDLINRRLDEERRSSSSEITNSGRKISFESLDSRCRVNIVCYLNDLQTVVQMTRVCKDWWRGLRRQDHPLLWRWMIRRGALPDKLRWQFWCNCVNITSLPTIEEYEALMDATSPSVCKDIARDVNRAYGSEPNKRFASRRCGAGTGTGAVT